MQRLMKIYYKGEITANAAAERVGFAMPEAGVYPGQLGKNVAGKEEANEARAAKQAEFAASEAEKKK
jgi:hypothetical protein